MVLGICLGAQIIGEALGAKTMRSPYKEVGIFPISLTHEGEADPIFKLFSKKFEAMHWHNDMPGIPENAVLLAYSEGCPQQAIRYGDRVYGLQFHMEITSELMKGMVQHCAQDLEEGRYVQTANQLLSVDLTAINQEMCSILDGLENIKISSKSASL